MGDLADVRAWEELIPDALGLIFRNLSLKEILTVVPRVCKAWNWAVTGPYCWREIDIEEWSRRVEPEQIDAMLNLLVRRSCGSFRRLVVSGLPNDSLFCFIAEHSSSLQSLELPSSEITDAVVEQVAGKLSNITFLDISSCKKIGARALKAFGKHCQSLVGLRRTMRPLEVTDMACHDEEAVAIALTMPKLRHLELAYLLLTTQGVLHILLHCPDLEFLDIRGCWDVKIDEKLKEKYAGVRVLGPDIVDDRSFLDEFSDYTDSSDYSWEFMDDVYDDDVYEDMSDEESVWNDDYDVD
ncbi:hypothetical protein M5K25_012117 [Dendrobium thyrsiflorum]|uniref:F-box protein FBW2 n=1 Tax=Dendrobium thyrsiflorum TaxID=117978 RepID=A0ABD0V352_DENTH